ncbi:MAG: hypothetical protein ACPGQL_05115 [Thermoplasmatota archaeon]
MSDLMMINLALAGLNALLALVVGVVFWRNHSQIRSTFTMALGLFALFFVFHNGVLIYHWATMMMDASGPGAVFLLVEGLMQTVALASLAYATLR